MQVCPAPSGACCCLLDTHDLCCLHLAFAQLPLTLAGAGACTGSHRCSRSAACGPAERAGPALCACTACLCSCGLVPPSEAPEPGLGGRQQPAPRPQAHFDREDANWEQSCRWASLTCSHQPREQQGSLTCILQAGSETHRATAGGHVRPCMQGACCMPAGAGAWLPECTQRKEREREREHVREHESSAAFCSFWPCCRAVHVVLYQRAILGSKLPLEAARVLALEQHDLCMRLWGLLQHACGCLGVTHEELLGE